MYTVILTVSGSTASEVDLVIDRVHQVAHNPHQISGDRQEWGLRGNRDVVWHFLSQDLQLCKADVVDRFIL